MTSMISHSSSTLNHRDYKNIEEIFTNNYIGKGQYVEKLEKCFKNYIEKKYVIAVSSGSAALFLLLNMLKKKFPNRKQVITSGYICPAVINPIFQNDLIPILVDINEYNLNININKVIDKINNNILAIIVPHLAGIPVDFIGLEDYDIPIIEDCAQSLGSQLNGKPTGFYSDYAVFSFGSTKMITGGQGGMILTNNKEYYNKIKSLIEYEKPADFYFRNGYKMAYNLNLTDYQAILVLSQMKQIDTFIQKRKKIATFYNNFFKNLDNVIIQKRTKNIKFNHYRYYTIWDYNIDNIILQLQENGIDARPSIAHNVYEYFNLNKKEFSDCEKLKGRVISMPIYPNLDLGKIKEKLGILKWIR